MRCDRCARGIRARRLGLCSATGGAHRACGPRVWSKPETRPGSSGWSLSVSRWVSLKASSSDPCWSLTLWLMPSAPRSCASVSLFIAEPRSECMVRPGSTPWRATASAKRGEDRWQHLRRPRDRDERHRCLAQPLLRHPTEALLHRLREPHPIRIEESTRRHGGLVKPSARRGEVHRRRSRSRYQPLAGVPNPPSPTCRTSQGHSSRPRWVFISHGDLGAGR